MRLQSFLRLAIAFVAITILIAGVASFVWSAEDAQMYAGKSWTAPGGDDANTRYSTLTQITAANAKQLGGAWTAEVPDRIEATPLVANGRMFVVTSQGVMMALDPATGATIWTFTPPTPFSGKRGVGIGDGMLFAGLRDSNVMAISQETGKLVWTSHHGPEIPSQGMATAPAYGNGVVVALVSLGDNFQRGRAIGFDSKTGNVLWSWDVVPGPGQPGHETWPQDSEIWKYGGGALWTTPSVDPDLGLVYLGTGNAVPQYGGELRPGNNLYDNSAVALDIKTGKMRWYFQVIHHDIWEGDLSTPLVLYDTTINGQPRKAVAAIRTDGELFVLDRETGKPILPVEERPVKQDALQKTSPTQPFTVGAERIGPECAPKELLPVGFIAGCYFEALRTDTPNEFFPNMNMRQAPMAYSPQTNDLYAVACVSPSWMRRGPTGWEFIFPVRPPGSKQYGVFAAINATSAKIDWQKRLPWSECYGSGGSLATAGGVIFHLEPDGTFYAYDAKTGDVLWHFQTGQVGLGGDAGPSAATAMSYEAGGQQFVAFANNRQVMAFKIGGTLPERPAPPPPPTVRGWTGKIDETSNIQLGTVHTYNILSANKKIDFVDDYGIAPSRAIVNVGTTVTFKNTSKFPETIEARDGSWSTATIMPGDTGTVTVTKPGAYDYSSKENPFMLGQLIVAAPQESGAPNAATLGVFTAEQAQRGQMAYKQSCSACHLDDLSGTERFPSLAGDAFMMNWKGKSVADLYNRTRLTMPQGAPGSLSPQTYIDLVAFLLQSNDFPAGNAELGTNVDALSHITIDKK